MIVVAGFFQFFALLSWLITVICFAVFILTKHFCKSSNTCGSSAHFANVWHAGKTEVVTVPFEKKKKDLLNYFFNLLYLKLWSENIFKTRLVSSEKYKPSFLSQFNFLNVPITESPKKILLLFIFGAKYKSFFVYKWKVQVTLQ